MDTEQWVIRPSRDQSPHPTVAKTAHKFACWEQEYVTKSLYLKSPHTHSDTGAPWVRRISCAHAHGCAGCLSSQGLFSSRKTNRAFLQHLFSPGWSLIHPRVMQLQKLVVSMQTHRRWNNSAIKTKHLKGTIGHAHRLMQTWAGWHGRTRRNPKCFQGNDCNSHSSSPIKFSQCFRKTLMFLYLLLSSVPITNVWYEKPRGE